MTPRVERACTAVYVGPCNLGAAVKERLDELRELGWKPLVVDTAPRHTGVVARGLWFTSRITGAFFLWSFSRVTRYLERIAHTEPLGLVWVEDPVRVHCDTLSLLRQRNPQCGMVACFASTGVHIRSGQAILRKSIPVYDIAVQGATVDSEALHALGARAVASTVEDAIQVTPQWLVQGSGSVKAAGR